MNADDHSVRSAEDGARKHQHKPRKVTPPPAHAYRVTSRHDRRARPLKPKQEAVLAALAHRCPHPGHEVSARVLSADVGLRLGSLMLSLRFLATQNLVREHEAADEGGEPTFSPTLFGLARTRDRRGV